MSVKSLDDVVIDHSNFGQYFFDVRQHRPKPGQVMAKFCAAALFVDGPEKRDIIHLLKMDKATAAAAVMRKIHCAKEPDCYRICREMCEDLANGMTDDEVAAKDYEFILESCYYTEREHVPKNDKHWETIHLIDFDPETNEFKVRIEV